MFDVATLAPAQRYSLLSSPLHYQECLTVVDDIIDNMDDVGLLELTSGSGGDLDAVLQGILEDT